MVRNDDSLLTAVKLLAKHEATRNEVIYGKVTWGYSRATCYLLMQVAKRFVEFNAVKGKYESIFAGEDDYTAFQLIELLRLDTQTVRDMHNKGVINTAMSSRLIREQVNYIKNLEG